MLGESRCINLFVMHNPYLLVHKFLQVLRRSQKKSLQAGKPQYKFSSFKKQASSKVNKNLLVSPRNPWTGLAEPQGFAEPWLKTTALNSCFAQYQDFSVRLAKAKLTKITTDKNLQNNIFTNLSINE